MYLSTVTLYEFGQFLQILVWIFIPMFVITALITTYIHYRRKKREGGEDELPLVFARTNQGSGEEDNSFGEESTTPYQGLLWMKNKYEQYQEKSDARYEQLKEKLRESEEKVQELKEALEWKESLDLSGARELKVGFEGERAPEGEKRSAEDIKNGIEKFESDEPGSDLTEENRILRERISELASVEDLIGEKDSQIRFLQNQLEQRIKNYHLVEYQGREDKNRITELHGQVGGFQALANGLKEEISGFQEAITGFQEEITGLKAEREALKIQVNELQEYMTKAGHLMATVQELHDLLEQEKGKTRELTLKLQNNSGLLLNIYNELDRSLREGKETPIPILLEQELESVDR